MKKKVPQKGLSVMLIVSMIGMEMGVYIPTVYAEGNSITVTQDQSVNTLLNLKLEGIVLDQTFSPDINTYSATVENKVQSINLLAESPIQDATITINGGNVKSGITNSFSLQTGENIFNITVNDGVHTSNTYTLTVTRKKNENNLLKNIELSQGKLTPEFVPTITNYRVDVANDVSEITVKPSSVEVSSTIKINESKVTNNGIKVKIPVGNSTISIVVTAENGGKKIYNLYVTRAAISSKQDNRPPKNNRPNTSQPISKPVQSVNYNQPKTQQQNFMNVETVSKATLSSLTVSEGTWDSPFSIQEFTYHVAVSSKVKTVTIKPTAKYSGSTILIEGSSNKTIKLESDHKNIISVVVSNGDERKTYVLVFDLVN